MGEKAIPLYQMMKKTDNFVWSDAANTVFEDLKRQLDEPPVLAAPIDKEPLLLYVAAMPELSTWLLWWNARRLVRNIRFNGRFIISAKCSLSQSNDIRIARSWCMGFSWQVGSLSNTFKAIPSLWSVPLHWETSFRTRRRLAGLLSGPLSLGLTG